MTSAAPAKKFSLVIGNAIAEMTKVAEFIEQFGTAHDIPQAIVNDLNLCLDELLNNTISYGYDDKAPHSIVVELALTDSLLIAEIKDDGTPFDPREAMPAAIGNTLQSRKVGGLGLQFVKALMDDISYERIGRLNVVKIAKRLRGA